MEINTPRLILRRLQESDREGYFDMMSNPNVMNPVPVPVMTRMESDANFDEHSSSDFLHTDKIILAAVEKSSSEIIGVAAYLSNEDGDPEIGYRLREKFWKKGYGTEIAFALLDYGFNQMNFEIITADVSIDNVPSVKILEKFMRVSHEFWSEKYKSFDRRYVVSFAEWESRKVNPTQLH